MVAMIFSVLHFAFIPEPIVVKVATPDVFVSNAENKGDVADVVPGSENVALTISSSAVQESRAVNLFSDLKIWHVVVCLYAFIFLLLSVPLLVNVFKVREMRKDAKIVKMSSDDVTIYSNETIETPFSFFRSIYLPQKLTETQYRIILTHEVAHIQHYHYIDVWVTEVVTRLLWWNPFVWLSRAELRNVHEFEADCAVLDKGEDVYVYQSMLIEEVLNGDIVIANGFNHSFIRRRFVEMLHSSNKRMSSKAKVGVTAYLLAVMVLFSCNVSNAETMYVYEPAKTFEKTQDYKADDVEPKANNDSLVVVAVMGCKIDTMAPVNASKRQVSYAISLDKTDNQKDDDPYKDFISPQRGLKCPNGYVRLTDYANLAKTDKIVAKQYELLTSTISEAKALRNKALADNYKDYPKLRYVELDSGVITKRIAELFKRRGIEMLDKGAYRLPNGTIVIEDDKHTTKSKLITYQKNSLKTAPVMLRDKSPNYSPFNEQTWPIYTNFEKFGYQYFANKPISVY